MKRPIIRGNFISEWFGQRIYPEVRLSDAAVSGQKWGVCPFLTGVKRQRTECIKSENAYGVCTINSVGVDGRQDWLVCPYRVIDSNIVKAGCETIFQSGSANPPIPVSILSDKKGIAVLEESLKNHRKAFLFFQDKLGGLHPVPKTPSLV